MSLVVWDQPLVDLTGRATLSSMQQTPYFQNTQGSFTPSTPSPLALKITECDSGFKREGSDAQILETPHFPSAPTKLVKQRQIVSLPLQRWLFSIEVDLYWSLVTVKISVQSFRFKERAILVSAPRSCSTPLGLRIRQVMYQAFQSAAQKTPGQPTQQPGYCFQGILMIVPFANSSPDTASIYRSKLLILGQQFMKLIFWSFHTEQQLAYCIHQP